MKGWQLMGTLTGLTSEFALLILNLGITYQPIYSEPAKDTFFVKQNTCFFIKIEARKREDSCQRR